MTAETECAISKIGASSSIATTAEELDVTNTIPQLLSAIESETENPQDVYQARSCVGWLHWVVAEYNLALERLPQGLGELDTAKSLSEWTSVCVLKSAYLRANCLMRDNKRSEALAAFHAALPSMDRVWSGHGIGKQLRYWSELFLTEYCTLSNECALVGETSLDDVNSIACYRSWARYWEAMAAPVTGGTGFKGSATAVPRRKIWNDYYRSLSTILQQDLPFTPGNFGKASSNTPPRSQLRAELKRVEGAYERLLLSETVFPRAEESREEVEEFVTDVNKNWTVLCGRGWSEQDLGQGGRAALSRGVLETLYNASTRTYHSTVILRSLFNVHISLAEFDLAFKALDSYLEIVKKGKARVEKTGIPEPSLDNDGTVLETMSQAVLALCLHGHHRSAEKARVLGAELEDWLSKVPQAKSAENGANASVPESGNIAHQPVHGYIIAQAWQAIGLSHAYWSRATYEASSRAEIQSRAIRCLRRSLSSEFGRSKDMRSLFAVSLLLAERKELATAIELVRSALMSDKEDVDDYSLYHGAYWQERSLIPLWHLLSLLLSARQDYPMAVRACEGALDQFKDPMILFGKQDGSFRSDHLNENNEKDSAVEAPYGLVDEMDDLEKEGILEVKMTQLALVELQDGPNAAVNASYELLTLFTRLFGNVGAQPVTNASSEPPKTSATSRGGIRGSIFGGKSDRTGPPTRQASNATVNEKRNTTLPVRPVTSQTTAASVQGNDDVSRPPRSRRGSSAQRSESGRRNSLKKRNRSESRGRAGSINSVSQQPTVVDGEPFFTPTVEVSQPDMSQSLSKGTNPRIAGLSREKTVSSLKSILSANSKTTEFSDLSPAHGYVTPHLLPLVTFSKEKERTRRTTVLVKVWMMIAGFYRRAGMLDECKAAVSEGQKLVQGLETEAARDASGPGSIGGAGWGERRSIDELWGDVYSEVCLHGIA